MNSNIALLIGLLAGLAAGLMVLAGFAGGSVSLVLIFASPAAVYIASLGWGTIAGIVAAIGGSVIAAYNQRSHSASASYWCIGDRNSRNTNTITTRPSPQVASVAARRPRI